jgi:choline kinase
VNIIIPIGGIGKRFLEDGYLMPKPLIKSLGKSIIFWNIGSLNLKDGDTVYIVYREEFNIKEMFPWQVECLTHREVAVVREK